MASATQRGGPVSVVDCFLNLTGASKGHIEGEATAKGQEKNIELQSFSFGAAQGYDPATAQATGKVKFRLFTITKMVDKATPLLMTACATGERITKAVITCRKAGKEQQEYLKITMDNAAIASWQIHCGDSTAVAEQASESAGAIRAAGYGTHDVVPFEEITFACPKIEIEYRPQKSDGTLGAPVSGIFDVRRT